MKTRINPENGKEEYWVEPDGLIGIWMTRGFCDRCQPFNDCLGLLAISTEEWESLVKEIDETKGVVSIESSLLDRNLKKCNDLV